MKRILVTLNCICTTRMYMFCRSRCWDKVIWYEDIQTIADWPEVAAISSSSIMMNEWMNELLDSRRNRRLRSNCPLQTNPPSEVQIKIIWNTVPLNTEAFIPSTKHLNVLLVFDSISMKTLDRFVNFFMKDERSSSNCSWSSLWMSSRIVTHWTCPIRDMNKEESCSGSMWSMFIWYQREAVLHIKSLTAELRMQRDKRSDWSTNESTQAIQSALRYPSGFFISSYKWCGEYFRCHVSH